MASFRRPSIPAPAPFPPAPQPVDHGVLELPNGGFFEADAPLSADERAWLDADGPTPTR